MALSCITFVFEKLLFLIIISAQLNITICVEISLGLAAEPCRISVTSEILWYLVITDYCGHKLQKSILKSPAPYQPCELVNPWSL